MSHESNNKLEIENEFLHKKVKITSDFSKLEITGNAPTSHATSDTVWYVHHVFYNISNMSYELNLMVTIHDGIMKWDRHLFVSVPHRNVKIVL